jgi:hypothetical protein
VSGGFDIDQLTSRLRRAITPPATAPANAPSDPTPRAAVQGPLAPGSPTSGDGDHPAPPPGASPSTRRPRRRRWAVPTSPAERNAPAVDQPPAELHPCPFCPAVHQPIGMRGHGLSDAYGQVLLSDPYSPRPNPRR